MLTACFQKTDLSSKENRIFTAYFKKSILGSKS
jgi:hypothetical protein